MEQNIDTKNQVSEQKVIEFRSVMDHDKRRRHGLQVSYYYMEARFGKGN